MTYRQAMQRNIVLKYRQIPTRNAGEEAFWRKTITSPSWRHPVTWRHRDHVQSIDHGKVAMIYHGHFAISYPLEPSLYLASFPRYLAPKLRQRLLRDDVINIRRLGFGETGSRSIPSAVPENPALGSNAKSIARSVAEISPFERLLYGQKSYCACAVSRDSGVGGKK